MYDNDSRGISYTAGFFMLIAFAIGGLFIGAHLSKQIWESMTHIPFAEMKTGLSNPANANAIKIVQIINAVVGFLLPTIAAAMMLHRRPAQLLGFTGQVQARQAMIVVFIMLAALIVASSFAYLTRLIPIPDSLRLRFDAMENDYSEQVTAIVSLRSTTDYIIALVVMAFLPAVCEEVLFRGGLQNFLSRGTGSPWMSIIVVSLLFSLAHASYYGFLSRFILGIALGAIFHYSGRLWLSILGHFINNALAITFLYIYVRQGKPVEQAMQQQDLNLWGLLAVPALVVLFIAFKKVSFPKRRLI